MIKTIQNKINAIKCRRVIVLILLDILVVNLSVFAALLMRQEFSIHALRASGFIESMRLYAPVNTAVSLAVIAVCQLYNSLWEYAGADELIHITLATGIIAGLQQLAVVLTDIYVPMSFPILNALTLFVMLTMVRFSYRFLRSLRLRMQRTNRSRTMVIGAGQAGAAVIREFSGSRHSRNQVVCVIDDDNSKQGRTLMGVTIVGGREKILEAASRYKVSEIVLAIPTLTNQAKKEIWEICRGTNCKLKQMPGLYQLANGDVSIQTIRDIQIEDLLGRDVVQVDMGGISKHIRGRNVLVTGGGGSIGSELCRQLASYEPRELVIFDIYENNAYAIEQELRASYPQLPIRVLIGSVRDFDRISSVMDNYRPEVVFHAAAHKHVPLMENSPLEAIKNNVFGTLNTARAAAKSGVAHFVLISSDKAVNPTNVMGATKRICEMIIQMMDETSTTSFAAVRFGNVLGSNGSVIPLFREQIKKGGPVTVTHPEINRYFMTIPEAVSLVLQAGVYARGSEIFVLDMGTPVKIDDLARNMIRLSGFEPDVDIPVVYTGLRPGEKLYEELLMNEEGLQKTANDLIYVGQKIPFDQKRFLDGLDALKSLEEGQDEQLRTYLQQIVPTYHPAEQTAAAV